MKLIIDNIDIYSVFGATLVQSTGELDMPKRKQLISHNWQDQHGFDENLDQVYFEDRQITLNFIIQATSQSDFYNKVMGLKALMLQPGLHVLQYPVIARPFFVKFDFSAALEKVTKWNSSLMVGKMAVLAIENYPVGLLFTTNQSSLATVTFNTLTSNDSITVYWGDGNYSILIGSGTLNYNYTKPAANYYIYVVGKLINFIVTNMTYIGRSTSVFGQNLVRGTSFANITNWSNAGNHTATLDTVNKVSGYNSMLITASGVGDITNNKIYQQMIYFQLGKTYTISFWAKASVAGTVLSVSVGGGSTFTLTTSWAYYSLTVTTGASFLAYTILWLDRVANCNITLLKIEEGNAATAWNFAPEDNY